MRPGSRPSPMSRVLGVEYWGPLVLWTLTIYWFSSDAYSAGQTYRLIAQVLLFFAPWLSPEQLLMVHAAIRKLAHVMEYIVLAGLAYRTLILDETDSVRPKLLAAVFVLSVALLDESRQTLMASRTGSLVDVGYDCLGGLFALSLITAFEPVDRFQIPVGAAPW